MRLIIWARSAHIAQLIQRNHRIEARSRPSSRCFKTVVRSSSRYCADSSTYGNGQLHHHQYMQAKVNQLAVVQAYNVIEVLVMVLQGLPKVHGDLLADVPDLSSGTVRTV